MIDLSIVPAYDLDPYCGQSCRTRRCDVHHDCNMLKFRRKQEVRSRLSEIIAYLATRHTAVTEADLVECFFLSTTRAGLDAIGRQYLMAEFTRLLGEALQRDQRVRRRHLEHRRVAWLPAGLDLPDPEPLDLPGTASLPNSTVFTG